MDPLRAFKSQTDKQLGTEMDPFGDPAAFLETPLNPAVPVPDVQALQIYTSEMARLANKLYGKSRRATYELAWRCLVCNTINGVQSNKVEPRKSCRKCARPRNNELTLKQETEIRFLIDNSGLSLEIAKERILGR